MIQRLVQAVSGLKWTASRTLQGLVHDDRRGVEIGVGAAQAQQLAPPARLWQLPSARLTDRFGLLM